MASTAAPQVEGDYRVIEILTRQHFGDVDAFELMELAHDNIEEYRSLSRNSQQIDKLVGMFSLEDRIIRKAAADIALGYPKNAIRLIQSSEGRTADLIRARAYQLADKHSEAIQYYEKAGAQVVEKMPIEKIFLAQCLCNNGRADEAEKIINSLSKDEQETIPAQMAKGLILEANSDFEGAIDLYEKMLNEHPESAEIIFRTAVLLDQRGEDDGTVEMLYRKIVEGDIFMEGAAINLALNLLDEERYDEAEKVFNRILRFDPNNERVWLYLQDARSSKNMAYDEGRHKEDEKLRQIMRLPISEFELSVRSRNCLARMNVHTLGDLISKSEPELLAYKNFGETSLKEIKEILNRKGLRLGMSSDEVERKMRSPSQRLAALTVTDNILDQPISAISLSIRSLRCLEALGIETVRELTQYTERSLLASKNFGLTSLTEVTKKLVSYGLSLKTDEL